MVRTYPYTLYVIQGGQTKDTPKRVYWLLLDGEGNLGPEVFASHQSDIRKEE
jgi:hypothetical protein